MKRIVKYLWVEWIALSLTCLAPAAAQDSVTVRSNAITPTVTVSPGTATQPFAENLIVTVTVSGRGEMPSGLVVLAGGGYQSKATKLGSGSAIFYLAPGSLAKGADTLTATYEPDAASQSRYLAATGTTLITMTAPGTVDAVVDINVLSNRHEISPFIYGINASKFDTIKGLSPGLVRWGGNQTSDYNWKLFTYNSGGDWFFNDYSLGDNKVNIGDSILHVNYVQSTGSHVLTTMPTLGWVAREQDVLGGEVRSPVQNGTEQSRCRQRPEARLQNTRDHQASDGRLLSSGRHDRRLHVGKLPVSRRVGQGACDRVWK